MSIFSSVIPGVREARAPLVAGYLWLVCLWLVLEPHAPSPRENAIYGRIAEIAEAVGPVGKALAVSVAAYLIGSLVQAFLRFAWRQRTGESSVLGVDERQHEILSELAREGGPRAVETILLIAKPSWEGVSDRSLRGDLSQIVHEIVDRELGESFRELEVVVGAVRRQVGEKAVCTFGMPNSIPVVRLAILHEGIRTQEEFVVPHFLPVRDLMGDIHLLQTRLLEIAEGTGSRIERLDAEAEFRFTVAPPLIVLVAILAVGVSPFWLPALVVPYALVLQAVDLSHQRAAQLLGALRARTNTAELEKVTPVFERYRVFATKLSEGLRKTEWPSV